MTSGAGEVVLENDSSFDFKAVMAMIDDPKVSEGAYVVSRLQAPRSHEVMRCVWPCFFDTYPAMHSVEFAGATFI